jgi:hypothetical protein
MATRRSREESPLKVGLAHEDLASGYARDGSRLASLREISDPKVPTKSLDELSSSELATLVHHRLQRTADSRLPIRMLGVAGQIDNARAMEEVRAMTHIGRALIDIEKRFIRFLLERNGGDHG